MNVCLNYQFNLLHHVGVVAKRVRASAAAVTAAETSAAAHEGDDNTASGLTGRAIITEFMNVEKYPATVARFKAS